MDTVEKFLIFTPGLFSENPLLLFTIPVNCLSDSKDQQRWNYDGGEKKIKHGFTPFGVRNSDLSKSSDSQRLRTIIERVDGWMNELFQYDVLITNGYDAISVISYQSPLQ
jgi:hypothetical protein